MSHRARLAWASKHLDALNGAIDAFLDGKPYSSSTKYDQDALEWVVRVHVHKGLPPEWSFMVGDIVHSMRSALDNLAYALVVAHNGPPSDAQAINIAFLACDTQAEFDQRCSRRLGLMSPPAQAAIRRLQPYHRAHPNNLCEPLSLLRDLSNVDKHRHVLVTAVLGNLTAMTVGPWHGRPSSSRVINLTAALEEGAVIGYVRFPDEPETQVTVDVQIAADVVVRHTLPGQPAHGHGVTVVLKELHDHLRDVVFPALEPFL
jgi:hypothetical protein